MTFDRSGDARRHFTVVRPAHVAVSGLVHGHEKFRTDVDPDVGGVTVGRERAKVAKPQATPGPTAPLGGLTSAACG
jgi:hypothetical protein